MTDNWGNKKLADRKWDHKRSREAQRSGFEVREINVGTSQPATGSNCGDRVWNLALDLRTSVTSRWRLRQGPGQTNQQLQSKESHCVRHRSSKQSHGNDSAWSASLSAAAGVQAVEAKWPNKEQKASCLQPRFWQAGSTSGWDTPDTCGWTQPCVYASP